MLNKPQIEHWFTLAYFNRYGNTDWNKTGQMLCSEFWLVTILCSNIQLQILVDVCYQCGKWLQPLKQVNVFLVVSPGVGGNLLFLHTFSRCLLLFDKMKNKVLFALIYKRTGLTSCTCSLCILLLSAHNDYGQVP